LLNRLLWFECGLFNCARQGSIVIKGLVPRWTYLEVVDPWEVGPNWMSLGQLGVCP
jgi:hypothetical protein